MSAENHKDTPGAAFDKAGQDEIEGRGDGAGETAGQPAAPAAGPPAASSLTNPEATPGAGALPSPTPDDEADAATG